MMSSVSFHGKREGISVDRKHLSVLFDTNVWLDYFLGRELAKSASGAFQRAMEKDDAIVTTAPIMRDVFYLVGTELKRNARAEGVECVQADSKAVAEVAWECIAFMRGHCAVLNVGAPEELVAFTLRQENTDFEDNLLIATAQRANVDYVITNDKRLLKSNLVPALSPREYADA